VPVGGKDRKDRDARAERERARLYQARRQFHESRGRRRTRDNLIAGIAGGFLILGLVAVQTAYFVAGPGMPDPAPTSTPTPTGTSPVPAPTPEPTSSPAPEATPTPTP
jgi:hypothetical protein